MKAKRLMLDICMYKRNHICKGYRNENQNCRFYWDAGNWPKCNKHGVTKEKIEEIFSLSPRIMRDPHPNEDRIRAIGKTAAGRYLFLVFTFRDMNNQRFIRPIGARYMHQKEIDHYEQSIS